MPIAILWFGIASCVSQKGAVVFPQSGTDLGHPVWWSFSLSKRCGQYRISKSKYAISIIAITLATESTKASVARLRRIGL
jgi:hypothetical protein